MAVQTLTSLLDGQLFPNLKGRVDAAGWMIFHKEGGYFMDKNGDAERNYRTIDYPYLWPTYEEALAFACNRWGVKSWAEKYEIARFKYHVSVEPVSTNISSTEAAVMSLSVDEEPDELDSVDLTEELDVQHG